MSIALFSDPIDGSWVEGDWIKGTWKPCLLLGIERSEEWGTNWIAIVPDGTGRILPFERVRTKWTWDAELEDWDDTFATARMPDPVTDPD